MKVIQHFFPESCCDCGLSLGPRNLRVILICAQVMILGFLFVSNAFGSESKLLLREGACGDRHVWLLPSLSFLFIGDALEWFKLQ